MNRFATHTFQFGHIHCRLYKNDSITDHPLRGIVCLLMAESVKHQFKKSSQPELNTLTNDQVVFAKTVEMFHLATQTHKEMKSEERHAGPVSPKLNTDTKISVLFGDFFWSKAWKEMSDLNNMDVLNAMTKVIGHVPQGQFMEETEYENVLSKLTLDYWIEKNHLMTASLLANGCESILKLDKNGPPEPEVLHQAYQFGQNFAFFYKASQEVQYLWPRTSNKNLQPLKHLAFCSLPLIMHYSGKGQLPQDVLQSQESRSDYDVRPLYEMIKLGPALDKSREVVHTFKKNALTNLLFFPESSAKECLKQIVKSIEN